MIWPEPIEFSCLSAFCTIKIKTFLILASTKMWSWRKNTQQTIEMSFINFLKTIKLSQTIKIKMKKLSINLLKVILRLLIDSSPVWEKSAPVWSLNIHSFANLSIVFIYFVAMKTMNSFEIISVFSIWKLTFSYREMWPIAIVSVEINIFAQSLSGVLVIIINNCDGVFHGLFSHYFTVLRIASINDTNFFFTCVYFVSKHW